MSLVEWRERWDSGDTKFVGELLEAYEASTAALQQIASADLKRTSAGWLQDIAKKALNLP